MHQIVFAAVLVYNPAVKGLLLMNKVSELIRNKRFPTVTAALIAANVIYFIVTALHGGLGNARNMIEMGADYAPLVFKEYQFWRLLTSMFMHFSFRHLAGNMIYLGIVGYTYEKLIGSWRFFLIYMLSGIGGNVVSCAYNMVTGHNAISAGASGAVYGVLAIVVYLSYIARKRTGSSQMFLRIAIMLVFMFYSNFASGSGIDIAAHIGGLAFGILLCLLFIPYKTWRH